MPGKHPSHSATNISELSGSVVNWLACLLRSCLRVPGRSLCLLLRSGIAIQHVVVFTWSDAYVYICGADKSKVMVQRRRSLSTAGSPQAERRLFLFNCMACCYRSPIPPPGCDTQQ
ncbi:uncharacterized protein LJ206_016073 [Theristicus caerulescens]